jgi:asparagine N-glycosylation enzyme membrane subunit Stt3
MRGDQLFVLFMILSLSYLTVMFYLRKDMFDINDVRKGVKIYITALLIATIPIWIITVFNFKVKITLFILSMLIWLVNFIGIREVRNIIYKERK